MIHITAIAILGLSVSTIARTTVEPATETTVLALENIYVLSESKGKGPAGKLSEQERVAVEIARDSLAKRLAADGGSFKLVFIQAVEWSDSGLGCPDPKHTYLAVVTPGYRVILKDAMQSYRVHVANDIAIVCQQQADSVAFYRPVQAISARALDRMQQEARQDLATRLNVHVDEVEVRMSIPLQWPDASLGCPIADVTYPAGVRHGFRIALSIYGRVVFYHTDGQRVFPCPAIETE